MRILISMGHPADIYLFKNLIWVLEKHGHEIKITARDKDVLLYLLDYYGFDYTVISTMGKSLLGLGKEMLIRTYRLFKIARDFKPDIIVAVGDPSISMVGKLLKVPSVTFSDTEHSNYVNLVSFSFSDVICTPSCYKKDIGRKQIRYNGYKELAYLHPNYFTPNPAVLEGMGLSKDDTFIILRFVSWTASHDVGHQGIQDKTALVRELEKYGQVFITSEGLLGGGLAKYKIKVSKMHDLLYYATLLYGESATMASECAVLGTHAIYCDFAGRGYTDEEEEKYGLVFNFKLDEDSLRTSLEKAVELLEDNNLKNLGRNKREKLLKDKIDVTALMVWFIENYPESFKQMKVNPKVQEEFK
jgi:predicted glycosyltransferase